MSVEPNNTIGDSTTTNSAPCADRRSTINISFVDSFSICFACFQFTFPPKVVPPPPPPPPLLISSVPWGWLVAVAARATVDRASPPSRPWMVADSQSACRWAGLRAESVSEAAHWTSAGCGRKGWSSHWGLTREPRGGWREGWHREEEPSGWRGGGEREGGEIERERGEERERERERGERGREGERGEERERWRREREERDGWNVILRTHGCLETYNTHKHKHTLLTQLILQLVQHISTRVPSVHSPVTW